MHVSCICHVRLCLPWGEKTLSEQQIPGYTSYNIWQTMRDTSRYSLQAGPGTKQKSSCRVQADSCELDQKVIHSTWGQAEKVSFFIWNSCHPWSFPLVCVSSFETEIIQWPENALRESPLYVSGSIPLPPRSFRLHYMHYLYACREEAQLPYCFHAANEACKHQKEVPLWKL